MQGPCEHCGNADKSKWTTQCIYKGDWPSHRAFVLSTFDAPCACDAYAEGQRELRQLYRQRFVRLLTIMFGIPAALIVLAFAAKHF